MSTLKIGAHLISPRKGYTHHGIYIGNNCVIHYAGLSDGIKSAPVEKTSVDNFCQGAGYSIRTYSDAKHIGSDVVKRAKSRLGEDTYSVFNNNCEHFCIWCITGKHDSKQVDKVTVLASTAATTATARASLALTSTAGIVAGTSGSGLMAGLASIGGTVGGGAVAGVALLGAAPALAMSSILNNTVLADNPSLEQDERDARASGRVATYGGAAAGTVGSIVAISSAGTAGLSAAGITSGLAAIGGTVGGGMAAGTAIAVAAPAAAAAAVGYGVYKLYKWISD